MMTNINPAIILNSLIKHDTLTIVDIRKAINLGVKLDGVHLNFLLNELIESGEMIPKRCTPLICTITSKGIMEGESLNENIEN